MINKIRKEIKSIAEESDWKYHIIPVVKYAKKLAKILKSDEKIVELAALLHDIGRLKFGDKDHDITGVPEAEKILKRYKYSQDIIDEIKHCIASHRSSKGVAPKTIIAKIIANADAMAHFDIVPVFFYWKTKKHSFEEALKWVNDKINRDWQKKLTLPVAKKMMTEKYKAIKLILDTSKEYIK